MSKKSDLVPKLLKKVQPRAPLPKPLKEATLLEQGLLAVLVRHVSQDKAEAMIASLRKIYPDWNEMRVSQNQEVASMLAAGVHRAPAHELSPTIPAIRDAREYLQEVFQKVHGFDLEWMREDVQGAAKLVSQMPFLGLSGGSFLLWIASGKELPVTPALVRVLDRLGLVTKAAAGGKKAREAVAPLVPAGEGLAFVSGFGEVADRWCHPQKPICHECPLVDDCPFGKKAFQDWKAQQARLEVQRQRDEAKRLVLEKKDAARRARDDARNQKLLEVEAKKLAKERAKQAAIDAKRKAIELREKQKVEAARKKAEADAAAAAKQAALNAKAAAEKLKKDKAAAAKAAAAKAKAAKSKPAQKKASKPSKPAKKSGKKR